MSVESDDRTEFNYPVYSRGEVMADAAAHVLGVLFGLVATIALVITASQHDHFLLILGASLYGLGLISMLTCSAAYNLWPPSPTKELLRRFDHAAIFLMIAGTYTPLLLNRVGGEWGVGLLGFVWAVALVGAAMKLVFPRRWESITLALYLGLGWSILAAVNPLIESVSMQSLVLIAVGGVIYSIGVVFHLWEKLPYQNAIWHWLVLTAAACHYIAVFNEVAIAGTM
ncbi:MAG: hemolysin III family protein [Alphaproteobacteria bacterium]|nr:hemolysin III family protein [Alphaproteobacteria bacterium]